MAAQKRQESDQNMYIGWCDVDDIESNRKRNRSILDKHIDNNTKKQLEMAAEQVQRFIEGLQCAIGRRPSTLATLEDLANELDSMKKVVDPKVTGSSAAVAGGAMAITGIVSVFIFGTGIPLITAGFKTAVVGNVTLRGAEDKMEKAQGVLNADKDAMTPVGDHYANLTRIAENISQSSPHLGSKDQILCSLFVANEFAGSKPNTNVVFAATVYHLTTMARTTAKQSGKIAGRISTIVASRFASKLAGVFTKGAFEGAGNVAPMGFGDAAAFAATRSFHISGVRYDESVKKVSTSITNAESLRKIARRYEEQLEEMKEFLTERSSLADDLEQILKEELKNLLETISIESEVSNEAVAAVWELLLMGEISKSWEQAFRDTVKEPSIYIRAISLIFESVKEKIKECKKKEKERAVVDLVFLAHGHVQNPLLPCTLRFMNERVESIELYVPWGCLLEATAAYRICTGMISVNNVQYSDTVLPDIPSYWNTLPKDYTRIPEVVFKPINLNQEVYEALMNLNAYVIPGRLVIPYFNPEATFQLPAIPLWTLCNAVAIAGSLLNERFRIHIVSCLGPGLDPIDETILTREIYPSIPLPTVNCRQYCAVPINPANPVTMRMMYDVPDSHRQLFDVLNHVLGTDPE